METTEINDVASFLKASTRMMSAMGQTGGFHGYNSLYDFVSQHGRTWTPGTKPKGIEWGRIKNCYQNAAELVLYDNRRELIYVEGYAAGIIPVMHAWCVTPEGVVVDNTWRTPGTDYFGIPFSREYLRESLLTHEVYGLIDLWKCRWPLLSLPRERWIHPLWKEKGS